MACAVRYDNPLKQGLKHKPAAWRDCRDQVRYDNPLKQGLKQPQFGRYPPQAHVRYDNPLKQGLKPRTPTWGPARPGGSDMTIH